MRFSQIRSYDSYIKANLQLNLLVDSGINCHLKDEHTVTIDPFLSPALGGIKLMVLDTDLSRAQQILENAEDAYIKTLACPGCGNKSLERQALVKLPGWGKRLVDRLRGINESVFSSEIICRTCGRRADDLGQFS